ncbi:MAG: M56 family metallopeptidase [Bacteroidota bacterium]
MTHLIQLPDHQGDWLLLFLESSLLLGLCLGYYQTILLPSRKWVLSRVFLLTAPVISLLLPLLNWEMVVGAESVLIQTFSLDPFLIRPVPSENAAADINWIGLVYGLGVGLLLARLLIHLWKIYRLTRHFPRDSRKLYTLILVDGHIPTSSFGRYIFWSPDENWSSQQTDQVLAHEICHVRQRHSLDLIFLECLMALAWFQPLLWLFRRVAAQNHEFLADQAALKHTDPKTYAHMLLAEVFGQSPSLVHSFFQSPISKRINMLHPISGLKKARLRAWFALPVLALGLIAVSCTMTDPVAATDTEIELAQVDPISSKSQDHTEVEHLPEPLNMVPLQKAIGYPKSAYKNNIEGMVVLRILVGTEGEYIRHELANDAPEVLVDAVEKSIKQIKFKPAQHKGEAVKCWVNIPFNFRLIE